MICVRRLMNITRIIVTEQCILQNEVIENTSDKEEQPLNPRQRYAQ